MTTRFTIWLKRPAAPTKADAAARSALTRLVFSFRGQVA